MQLSPLTLTALSVGSVLFLLLLVSLSTMAVSRYNRQNRRRAQHTRCQLAIRFAILLCGSCDCDPPALKLFYGATNQLVTKVFRLLLHEWLAFLAVRLFVAPQIKQSSQSPDGLIK